MFPGAGPVVRTREELKMADIISALFDDRAEAEKAVQDLRRYGVPDSAITVIAHRREEDAAGHAPAHDAGSGAASGLGVGVVVGALFGLGSILIPGLGPLILAGGLASALGVTGGTIATGAIVGGVAGTIAGALSHWGLNEAEARHYAGAIERGGTYVGVDMRHTNLARGEIVQLLQSHGGRIEVPAGVNAGDTTPGDWVSTAAQAPVVTPREPVLTDRDEVRSGRLPGTPGPAGVPPATTSTPSPSVASSSPAPPARHAVEDDLARRAAALRPGETLRVPIVEEELVIQRVRRETESAGVEVEPLDPESDIPTTRRG